MGGVLSGGSGIGRPAWYDRNPLDVININNTTESPEAVKTLWTYTVPVNRKCLVELLDLDLERVTVATAPHTPYTYIALNGNALLITQFSGSQNTVGYRLSKSNTGTIILLAGDILTAKHANSDTGGTLQVVANMKGTEFDA
jgi:hypothetical protein